MHFLSFSPEVSSETRQLQERYSLVSPDHSEISFQSSEVIISWRKLAHNAWSPVLSFLYCMCITSLWLLLTQPVGSSNNHVKPHILLLLDTEQGYVFLVLSQFWNENKQSCIEEWKWAFSFLEALVAYTFLFISLCHQPTLDKLNPQFENTKHLFKIIMPELVSVETYLVLCTHCEPMMRDVSSWSMHEDHWCTRSLRLH